MPSLALTEIINFCVHHNYQNPPIIKTPLPSSDLTAVIQDPFDFQFISRYNLDDLVNMLSYVNKLNIPSLVQLCECRIASLFKGLYI